MAGPGSGQDANQTANQNANQPANQNANQKANQNANQSTNQARKQTVIRNLDNNRDGNEENAESRNAGTVKRKISVYQQAALMQPRIAPAPAQQKKKSKSAWGTIKHGLFTALSALSTATVGGFFRLAARAFTKFKRYERTVKTGIAENAVKTKSDTGIIPGTKNERFKDPDVDKLGSDQPVIDDTRRVPLVFEREIFDDPNQKPTITLNFRQAREGSSAAFSSRLNAGHAFLTLKYTKQDPLTREDRRYQVTVGFGSQANPLTGGAELLNGMFVPGRIIDDHGNYAEIAKEYTISNQAMNRVILAVQKYETGGYQLMKRNCTTFVADMAKEAGLEKEAGEFMKEADFELEANPLLGLAVPGVLFLGPAATELGKYAAYKDIGKKTYEYSRFGQNLYNEDEILRIKKTELNARMYGYDPSASGEALRKMKGVGLNSTAYGNEIRYAKPSLINRTDMDGNDQIYRYRFEQMLKRMNDAKRSLQAVLDKKYPGHEKNNELMGFLEDTTSRFREKSNELFQPEVLNQPKERRKLYKEFWGQVSDGMKKLNEYYLNHYEGNKEVNREVNIRFQHMSSVFANTKLLIMDFEELNQRRLADDRTPDRTFEDYIDQGRDSARWLNHLFFEEKKDDWPDIGGQGGAAAGKKPGEIKIPYAELAVSPQVYGSMKNCVRYYMLKNKPKRTKEEAVQFAELSERSKALSYFVSAQRGYAGTRAFSLHDYKYAFVDLPKEEKESGLNLKDDYFSPAKIYQTVALERIFGGLKKRLSEELKKDNCSRETLYSAICSHAAEKIRENKGEYKNLAKCLCYDEMHSSGKYDKNDINFQKKCMEKANSRILEAFQDVYCYPILRQAGRKAGKYTELKLNTMDKKRIQELSGFQNLIESIHESTGVRLQPVKKENILRGQNTVSAGEKKHETIYAKH